MSEKRISYAKSYPNGISISSSNYPEVSIKVYQDEDGKRHHLILPTEYFDLFSQEIFEDKAFKTGRICILIFDILLILTLFLLKMYTQIIVAIFFAATSTKLADFIVAIYVLKHTKSGKDTARFHAAEHMSINAYHKYQRIPTITEIKHSSRFSDICGSVGFAKLALIPSLFYTIYLLSQLLVQDHTARFILMTLDVVLTLFLLFSKKLFTYFQIFLTAPPTDNEIMLAIDVLKGYELFEKVFGVDEQDKQEDYSPLEEYFDHAKITKTEDAKLDIEFDDGNLGLEIEFIERKKE
ncbi:MAG: DUF1385 domain-containing protein [Clostridia bacterium]|nr:DUF1385 domain-containing protein [Clostridia bacterium]